MKKTIRFPSEKAYREFETIVNDGSYKFKYMLKLADGTIEATYDFRRKKFPKGLAPNEIQTELF